MTTTTTTSTSENIFAITGQHSIYKLKNVGDDAASTNSTSRLNHSIAYGNLILCLSMFIN